MYTPEQLAEFDRLRDEGKLPEADKEWLATVDHWMANHQVAVDRKRKGEVITAKIIADLRAEIARLKGET
jgi:hypothetical protein